MEISAVTRPTEAVRRLISELDGELGALYEPQQRHSLAWEQLFAPHIRFFAVMEGAKALGCGGVALFADFAEVKRMYVRPAARGRGLADTLMTRLVAEARQAGLHVLRLETGTDSHAAIRFYRRHGFRDCPAFDPYAALPPHRIAASLFMERDLA